MKLKDLLETIQLVDNKIIIVRLHDFDDLEKIVFEIPGFECLDDDLLEQEIGELRILTGTCIKINLKEINGGDPDPTDPVDPDPAP